MTSTQTSTQAPVLPASLRVGAVELTVTDLDRSAGFYEHAIGLKLHRREDGRAALGAGGEDLLVLVEAPDARPAGRHAGLYHFALLHPSRLELARAAQRLIATRTPISGASDHKISEAIYLPDPDGNGIELARAARRLIATDTPVSGASDHKISEAIYLPDPDGNGIELAADRSREHWGDLSDPTALGGPMPLDMQGLLAMVEGEQPHEAVSPDLRVGHVHLHVGDIERALAFWRDLIGFEVMTRFPSAAFIAAGGYHHHLGLNTWRGEGVPAAPGDAVGLRHWTVELDDAGAVSAVRERLTAGGAPVEERPGGFLSRDPWNNAVLVVGA